MEDASIRVMSARDADDEEKNEDADEDEDEDADDNKGLLTTVAEVDARTDTAVAAAAGNDDRRSSVESSNAQSCFSS